MKLSGSRVISKEERSASVSHRRETAFEGTSAARESVR
jgi:hypothetical protein